MLLVAQFQICLLAPPHWVSVFRSSWLWFGKNVNLVCCHSYQGGGACKCLWCHGSLCGVNMHLPTTECLSGKVVNWFAHVFCWGLFLFVLNRANEISAIVKTSLSGLWMYINDVSRDSFFKNKRTLSTCGSLIIADIFLLKVKHFKGQNRHRESNCTIQTR